MSENKEFKITQEQRTGNEKMRRLEITETQIRNLAGFSSAADVRHLLNQWFPAVFESEWKEVDLRKSMLCANVHFLYLVHLITKNKGYVYNAEDCDYKIEDGKIFGRRK